MTTRDCVAQLKMVCVGFAREAYFAELVFFFSVEMFEDSERRLMEDFRWEGWRRFETMQLPKGFIRGFWKV